MADQASLEQKYAPVGKAVTDFAEYGTQMMGIFMNGDKLVLKCNLPSKVVLNRVWDAIKKVDPVNTDFELQADVAAEQQPYTIKPGDTLSAVSQKFYGSASKFTQVAEANGIDADEIQTGKTIHLPVLE